MCTAIWDILFVILQLKNISLYSRKNYCVMSIVLVLIVIFALLLIWGAIRANRLSEDEQKRKTPSQDGRVESPSQSKM